MMYNYGSMSYVKVGQVYKRVYYETFIARGIKKVSLNCKQTQNSHLLRRNIHSDCLFNIPETTILKKLLPSSIFFKCEFLQEKTQYEK